MKKDIFFNTANYSTLKRLFAVLIKTASVSMQAFFESNLVAFEPLLTINRLVLLKSIRPQIIRHFLLFPFTGSIPHGNVRIDLESS